MDTRAAELGRLKDSQATRTELIAQIIRLGTLYQAIKTGEDLLLQDRYNENSQPDCRTCVTFMREEKIELEDVTVEAETDHC